MDFASILAIECWTILSRGYTLELQSLQSSWCWLPSMTCAQIPRVAVENTPGSESSRFVHVESITKKSWHWVTAYIRMLILKDQQNGRKKKKKRKNHRFPFFLKSVHLCSTSHAWHIARIFGWIWGSFSSVWIFWLHKQGRVRRGWQQ